MSMTYNGHEIVFGLDIGTRSIVGTVGYKDARNRFQVLAQEEKFHEQRSMLDGQIHDIGRVAETISFVKEKLESKLNTSLTEVCIAAAGRVLKTAVGMAEIDLADDNVVDDELVYSVDMLGVEKANDIIQEENDSEYKFYCVGYTVVRYFLNGFAISNLIGHKAHKIGAEVLATFLPEDVVDGLYASVGEAGLEVVNLTLEPIAAMNVAIPEQYRLLNLALVDVGAGTSDICITKDGTIVAYGMIPFAGDKLTEILMQKYLVDFDTAEKIKMMPANRKTMTYSDIMGDKQKITRQQLDSDLKSEIKGMAKQISDKIKELNGGKAVNAVFVVGGGGKVNNFTKELASALGLVPNRVALRGEEVMGSIDMVEEGLKKDSLYVTPIGICINYYEKKNNFIFVTVNGERIKLYNNNKLTVMDAAAAASYPNENLFPKRGGDLNFTVNGKSRIQRGQRGEAAVIKLNGKEVNMTTTIDQNDKITISESTRGDDAYLEVGHLPEFKNAINFMVNGAEMTCPRFIMVNGEIKSEYYKVCDKDQIVILDYYTVEQLLLFLDLPKNVSFYINHEKAAMKDRIYDHYMINWAETKEALDKLEKETAGKYGAYGANAVDTEEETDIDNLDKEESDIKEPEAIDETVDDAIDEASDEEMIEKKETKKAKPKKAKTKKSVSIKITVNGEEVSLEGKPNYTFVDILDVYPFDLSEMGGSSLATTLNGVDVDFTAPLKENDQARIFWNQ